MTQDNKAVELKKLLTVVAGEVEMSEKDLQALVAICEIYGVDPTTLQGALYCFYLMVFDKEKCIQQAQDKGKAMDGIAKALSKMTIGLLAGIDVPISKAVSDVLLTAVERDEVEPQVVTIILGSKGELNHYMNMIKMTLGNLRRDLGDVGY